MLAEIFKCLAILNASFLESVAEDGLERPIFIREKEIAQQLL